MLLKNIDTKMHARKATGTKTPRSSTHKKRIPQWAEKLTQLISHSSWERYDIAHTPMSAVYALAALPRLQLFIPVVHSVCKS